MRAINTTHFQAGVKAAISAAAGWVARLEVEFFDNQEDDGPDCRKAGEATCTALGCLEQPIDGFQKSIGLARLRPSHDALQMCSDHSGNLFHWFNTCQT
jgi:hypothetical protein